MAERLGRLSEEIKREVSSILAEMSKTPSRYGEHYRCECFTDLSWAKVYFSQLGSAEEREKTLEGLNRAKGFVRTELSKRLRVRHTPEIIFQFDPSLEEGAKMDALLKTLQGSTGNEGQNE